MSAPSPSNRTTVCFNVGGTIYEVSRSLLDQHSDTMLARIASDTWNNGNQHAGKSNGETDTTASSLFIERDGERFKYCLDYMRDGGTVVLPHTIPKDALVQDLIYFGFEDIDLSKICVEGTIPMYGTCLNHIELVLADLDSSRKEFLMHAQLHDLARACLVEYKQSGSLKGKKIAVNKELLETASKLESNDELREGFDAILNKMGWKYKSPLCVTTANGDSATFTRPVPEPPRSSRHIL